MKTYGVLIVGSGWVSTEHIRAYEMHPQAKVVALYSRDAERGKKKIAECGIPDATVYTDYAEALRDPKVDIVSICTPNHLHAQQAVQAAKAGKHLLIEKPLAMTLEETRAVQAAVKKANVRSLVGYVLHWNPLFLTAKAMQEEYIGNVFYAETDFYFYLTGNWSCYDWTCKKEITGSSLLAGGCHAVDALRFFMQQEVEEVTAYSVRGRDDLEYDGTLTMLLKFQNGAVGRIGSSYDIISPYIFNLHLYGDKGTLRNTQLYSPEKLVEQKGYMTLPVEPPNSEDVSHHPFPQEIAHLIQCIEEGKETEISVEDAAKTQEVIHAADRSAEEGRPVRISELR